MRRYQYPFRRLFEHLAPLLAADGALAQAIGLPVEVLWQTGDAPVDDLPIQATPALPAAELGAAQGKADLVIRHAGTGSALAALNAGRYPILAIGTATEVSRSTTTRISWPPNSPSKGWPCTATRRPSPSTT